MYTLPRCMAMNCVVGIKIIAENKRFLLADRVNIQIDSGTEDEVSQKDKLKDNFELKSR